jgi:hypothetical protein
VDGFTQKKEIHKFSLPQSLTRKSLYAKIGP